MTGPVSVAFNRDQTRAGFRLFHPKRNPLAALTENPHLELVGGDRGISGQPAAALGGPVTASS